MWTELCLFLVINFQAVEQKTCIQIVEDAIEMGAEKHVYDLLSTAWHESRFTASAISGTGKYVGALQHNKKFVTNCEDCTEIQQAISIFLKFKTKDRCLHLARYMKGWNATCDERVLKRLRLADKIKRLHSRIKRRRI